MNRELKDIMQVFTIALSPFAVGALFTPFVWTQLRLGGDTSETWTNKVALAWWVSSVTFGLLALIIVGIISKLYERAGHKAWEKAMDDVAELDGRRPNGSFGSGFFYWSYNVEGRPSVCTRFAPSETRSRSLVA